MPFPAALHIMKQPSKCDTEKREHPRAEGFMVSGMTVGMFLLNPEKGFTPRDHLIRFLPAKGERSRTSIDKLGLAENPNRVPFMEKKCKITHSAWVW